MQGLRGVNFGTMTVMMQAVRQISMLAEAARTPVSYMLRLKNYIFKHPVHLLGKNHILLHLVIHFPLLPVLLPLHQMVAIKPVVQSILPLIFQRQFLFPAVVL